VAAPPSLKQIIDTGVSLGAMTRQQAERVTQQLVRRGELEKERAQGYAEELLERSRKQSDQLLALVRKEIRAQLANLGLATKADVAAAEGRLRAEIAALKGRTTRPARKPAAKGAAATKVTRPKPPTAGGSSAGPSGSRSD
jgi:polyhydroxyalkanoate synthesis regulator phasin